MKIPWTLILAEAFVVVVVFAYMGTFPIFPEVRSADFGQHLAVSRDYAQGHVQSFSAQLLYSGVEWLLAVPQFLMSSADPFVLIRWTMALLVMVSPFIVYLTTKEILMPNDGFRSSDKEKADWTAKVVTLVYSFSGLIWVEMVFISGLYANFFGVLASLAVAASAFWLARGDFSWKKAGVFVPIIVVAYFSHYSTVLVFPPLMLYLGWRWWKQDHRERLGTEIALAGLVVPPALGILLFSSLIDGFLGFLQPTVNVFQQATSLSQVLVIPSLQFLDEEVTDWAFLFLMLMAWVFAYYSFREKSPKMLMVLAWFVLPLAVAPWNSSAWRFSFISLAPATLMAGWVLARLFSRWKPNAKGMIRGKDMVNLRNVLFIGLLLFPNIYPSWAFQAFDHSLSSSQESYYQPYLYDGVRWIGQHIGTPYFCHNGPADPRCQHIVSVTDWRLQYDSLFNGSQVFYAPDYGISWQDPFQTAIFALSHNASYVAVTRDATVFIPSCDPRGSLGFVLSTNSSTVPVDRPLKFTVSSTVGINTSVNVFDDGQRIGAIPLSKGTGTATVSWPSIGLHQVFVALGSIATESLNITVGQPENGAPWKAVVPYDYCSPWRTFNPSTLPGWTEIYFNPDVAIWKAP